MLESSDTIFGNHSWPNATGAVIAVYSNIRSVTMAVAKTVNPEVSNFNIR